MQMVPTLLSRYPVRKMAGRRKYPLPPPLSTGVWIFSFQGIRQRYTAQAPFQILIVLPLHGFKVSEERLLYRRWKHGMAVFVSLTRSNEYLVLGKIDVLDPETATFHHAQSSAVKQH